MVDSRLQGIIYQLTQQYGKNVVDAGLVTITSNHYSASKYSNYNAKDPKYVFEYESQLGFYDDNNHPSWIKFDFNNKKYNVKKYTIQFGYDITQSTTYPQKWLLQGSNDDSSWVTIDNRESETKNHANFEIEQYSSQNDPNTEFRYIRLYLENFWAENTWISLNAIEFFGESKSLTQTNELPHQLSFKGLSGKFVNDSLGFAFLEGDKFNGTLVKGVYSLSAWSFSATTFIEAVLKITRPMQCTIEAPYMPGYDTTISIDSELIIKAPYSIEITPFAHSSLRKVNYTQNFYYYYSNFLMINENQKGRVVVGYSPIIQSINISPCYRKDPVSFSSVIVFLLNI